MHTILVIPKDIWAIAIPYKTGWHVIAECKQKTIALRLCNYLNGGPVDYETVLIAAGEQSIQWKFYFVNPEAEEL